MIGKILESEVLEVVPPRATSSYTPILNELIIQELESELYKNNISIKKKNYSLGGKGNQMVGQWLLEANDIELGPQIVFRNSYDKTTKFEISTGAFALVCSNGLIALKNVYSSKRKHTGNAVSDSKELIKRAVGESVNTVNYFKDFSNNLKDIEVDKKLYGELLGRLFFEQKAITSSQLNIINREFQFSNDFKSFNINSGEIGTTAWNMYNHVTEALKTANPKNYIRGHVMLTELFKETFSLS